MAVIYLVRVWEQHPIFSPYVGDKLKSASKQIVLSSSETWLSLWKPLLFIYVVVYQKSGSPTFLVALVGNWVHTWMSYGEQCQFIWKLKNYRCFPCSYAQRHHCQLPFLGFPCRHDQTQAATYFPLIFHGKAVMLMIIVKSGKV